MQEKIDNFLIFLAPSPINMADIPTILDFNVK